MTATTAGRRSRSALVVAVVLFVVVGLLIAVLATRDSAATRISSSPLLGRSAPDLTGRQLTADGVYDLRAQRGRFVLVNFFATWCVPCRKEHPELVRFANSHAATGDAEVVSVVFGDEEAQVRDFFTAEGGDWPVVADADGAIATSWGVSGVPESYLVAPSGVVVSKITGGIRSSGDIDRLIGELVENSGAAR